MSRKRKTLWMKTLGYLFCILPPVLATLEHFPLWIKSDKTTSFSFLGLLLLLLCLIPFRKGLKQWLRTPSAWQMWLLLWGLLYFTRHITEGLLAVASVGFPTSLFGALFFHIAKKIESEE